MKIPKNKIEIEGESLTLAGSNSVQNLLSDSSIDEKLYGYKAHDWKGDCEARREIGLNAFQEETHEEWKPGLHMCYTEQSEAVAVSNALRENAEIETRVVKV